MTSWFDWSAFFNGMLVAGVFYLGRWSQRKWPSRG